MKRTILFGLLIVGLLLAGTHVFGWSGGPGMRGGQDCSQRGAQRMSDQDWQQRQQEQQQRMAVILDLSEEQQQQLQTLREERREKQQSLRTEMQASREKLHEVARANDADEASIRAAVQEHAELKTRKMVDGANHRRQMAAVLTPEQQQKFEQMRELKGDNSCGMRGQSGKCGAGDCTPGEKSGRRGGQGPRI
ncbi:Spy/CpxP family protein refolding chaperone [Pelovirga terrestris]|uniref:Spy/CpxP family protein refolding chaperone n=1 Tax=Pelovirga terrestris TaxID=2771352 RepID=A0A8J6QUV6_9BACT|nr:Spy/CpxP family protein refolding chaperone [Pelovirga terrestris]MBD1400820.1 Spy/CpxP family protein refolding chaperone [Pelovirga terrestris]